MDKEALAVASSPIVQGLASELIATTPEHWSSFSLYVQVFDADGRTEDIKINIKSNEGKDDIVTSTEDLNEIVFKLLDFFREHSRIQTFRCDVFLKPDGKWGYETDFQFYNQK